MSWADEQIRYLKADVAQQDVALAKAQHRIAQLEQDLADTKEALKRLTDTVGILNVRTSGMIKLGGG